MFCFLLPCVACAIANRSVQEKRKQGDSGVNIPQSFRSFVNLLLWHPSAKRQYVKLMIMAAFTSLFPAFVVPRESTTGIRM